MPPPPAEAVEAPRPAGVEDELRAVAALHEVGADLGDPLDVAVSGSQEVVSGAGIPPARQQEIRAALSGLPNVAVRFSEMAAPPEPAAAGAPAPAAARPDSRLENRLGGRAQMERFSADLLDRSDAAMARAYALRRLAQQFPPEAEARLSSADRALLRKMAREHLAALTAGMLDVEMSVDRALGARQAAAHGAGPDSGAWQLAAGEALRSAREVESSVAALLGTAPGDRGVDQAARFAAGMGALKASLNHCQRLLSYD
jgi:hypothetical protein